MDINHATPEMTCLHRYSLDSTFILLVICGSIGLSAQQSGVPQVKQSSQPRIVKPVGEEEVKLFCNVKEAVSYTWYKNGKVIPAALDRYTVKKYSYLLIVDVVKSDSGLFVCVASNGYGSANCTINFLVKDPSVKPTNITGEKPQFRRLDLMRKTKKEFRVGDKSVALTCEAVGKPTPIVTWYKDGKIYESSGQRPGPYDYQLEFNELDVTDSGSYMCNVSNAFGFLTCTYNITVKDVIRSQPNILVIWEQKSPLYVGENVEIFCTIVTQDPNTKYRWYRSDTNIWNEEKLGVLIDPQLYEQPEYNGGKQEMANVKFTLTLQNLTINQSGLYGCRAENKIGPVSRQANLTVTHRPPPSTDVINNQPFILAIWEQKAPLYVGQNVEISCTILTFDPNTKYRWYYSDTNIRDEDNLGVLIDPRLYEQPAYNGGNQEMAHVKFTLTLQNLAINQSGLYGCRAENKIGPESRQTNLTVTHRSIIIPPVFADTSAGALTELPAGHSVMLKCKADGAAPLKYTWLKDGKILRWRTLDPYLNTSIWYLKLKDLVPGDAGEYTCIVSNPYGSINHTYSVRVLAKPQTRPILRKDLPRNKSAQVGESVTMKCLVFVSATLPDFRWLKWDKSITFVSKIGDNLIDDAFLLIDPKYYSTIQRGESYGSELKISNVTEEDFGLYTCYASNHIGAEYNSAFLSRYVRPTRALPSDRVLGQGNISKKNTSWNLGENSLEPKGTGSESDDPVIMGQVSWILLGVSITVFVAMVTASAWLCMKMRKLKNRSRANARGSRHDIGTLRPRYDVQNEYVVVPNFN